MLVYIELALSLVGLYCKALVSAVHLNCRPLITTINELGLVFSIEGKLYMAFWLVCVASLAFHHCSLCSSKSLVNAALAEAKFDIQLLTVILGFVSFQNEITCTCLS